MRAHRSLAAALSVVAVVLTACASGDDDRTIAAPTADNDDEPGIEAMLDPCTRPNLTTVEPGAITFLTPAAPAPPYFLTDEPADQLGLESALAYALAEQLGFRPAEVTWEVVGAEAVLSGEFIDYDIAIGGFSPDDERFPALEFSSPYLTTGLAVVVGSQEARDALVGTGEPGGREVKDLRWAAEPQGVGVVWAAQRGWLPSAEPGAVDRQFRGAGDAVDAGGEADVLILDEPTLQWLADVEGRSVDRLSYPDAPEATYALAMVAGNPLMSCVERALGEMSADGRLADLADEWLDVRNWEQ